MKRFVFILTCILATALMVACGASGEYDETESYAETAHTVSVTETAEVVSESTTEETMSPEMSSFLEYYDYIPAAEWTGLETVAYHEDGLNIEAHSAVLQYPQGSPDPKRYRHEQVWAYDLSQVVFKTQKEQYSLDDDCVIAELTLRADSKYDKVYYYYSVNVERWNGSDWDRLILPLRMKGAALAIPYVERGQTATLEWHPYWTVTKLTPGRYRIVGYVDYVPVYAEFEFVE